MVVLEVVQLVEQQGLGGATTALPRTTYNHAWALGVLLAKRTTHIAAIVNILLLVITVPLAARRSTARRRRRCTSCQRKNAGAHHCSSCRDPSIIFSMVRKGKPTFVELTERAKAKVMYGQMHMCTSHGKERLLRFNVFRREKRIRAGMWIFCREVNNCRCCGGPPSS